MLAHTAVPVEMEARVSLFSQSRRWNLFGSTGSTQSFIPRIWTGYVKLCVRVLDSFKVPKVKHVNQWSSTVSFTLLCSDCSTQTKCYIILQQVLTCTVHIHMLHLIIWLLMLLYLFPWMCGCKYIYLDIHTNDGFYASIHMWRGCLSMV